MTLGPSQSDWMCISLKMAHRGWLSVLQMTNEASGESRVSTKEAEKLSYPPSLSRTFPHSQLFHWESIGLFYLPIRGTESDVAGIISATRSIKTVSDSNTVIPEKIIYRIKPLESFKWKAKQAIYYYFPPKYIHSVVLESLWFYNIIDFRINMT